jgi:5'(3')-deoxyribonucleotidase
VKHPRRVLIDVDDVAGQFRRAAIEVANRLFNLDVHLEDCIAWNIEEMFPTLSPAQITCLWEVIESPGWAQKMRPMEGAVSSIARIAAKYEVAFVTKPLKSSPTWGYDRRKWVAMHFGESLAENLHSTGMKYAVDGDYLIEDTLSHLAEWLIDRKQHSKRTFKGILYAWPYNEVHTLETRYHVRLPDWYSIVSYLGC